MHVEVVGEEGVAVGRQARSCQVRLCKVKLQHVLSGRNVRQVVGGFHGHDAARQARRGGGGGGWVVRHAGTEHLADACANEKKSPQLARTT